MNGAPTPRPPAPSRHAGVRSSGWWGAALAIVVLGTVLGALVYAYVQLAAGADEWPPPEIGPLGRRPFLAAAALLVVSTLTAWRTGAAFGADRRRPLLASIAATVALGAGALALIAGALRDQPGVPGDHAYVSLVVVLGWYALVVIGVGLALQLVTGARVLHGRHDSRLHVVIDVTRALWWYAVASTLVVVGTLVVGGTP